MSDLDFKTKVAVDLAVRDYKTRESYCVRCANPKQASNEIEALGWSFSERDSDTNDGEIIDVYLHDNHPGIALIMMWNGWTGHVDVSACAVDDFN